MKKLKLKKVDPDADPATAEDGVEDAGPPEDDEVIKAPVKVLDTPPEPEKLKTKIKSDIKKVDGKIKKIDKIKIKNKLIKE